MHNCYGMLPAFWGDLRREPRSCIPIEECWLVWPCRVSCGCLYRCSCSLELTSWNARLVLLLLFVCQCQKYRPDLVWCTGCWSHLGVPAFVLYVFGAFSFAPAGVRLAPLTFAKNDGHATKTARAPAYISVVAKLREEFLLELRT